MDDARPGSILVLHVEDAPSFLNLAKTCLERESDRIEVVGAGDATEALSVLADRDVDCVVSDHEMPGRDGIELLRAVRADHPDLPFVLFTGKGSEAVASDAISAGVTDYLQKEGGTDQFAVLANRIENAVESHRSRTVLAERNRHLETLVANLPGIVYRCGTSGDWPMQSVQGDCESLLGVSATALESGAVSLGTDIIHPDDREAVWEAIQGAIEDDEPFEITYRVVVDGEPRRVWEGGREVEPGVLEGFITDVVDRELPRDTVTRKVHMFDSMMEQLPVGIYFKNTDAEHIRVSTYQCEQYGTGAMVTPDGDHLDEPSDFIGKTDRDIYRPEIADAAYADDLYVVRTGEAIRNKVEHHPLPDGRDRWVATTKVPWYDEAGDVKGLIGTSQDITAQKRTERRLQRQNEHLEEFASIVSHDLRNPLNAAQGYLQQAREHGDEAAFAEVATAHERMRTLIEDLLALARGREDATDLQPVSLAEAFEAAWGAVDAGDAERSMAGDRRVLADPDRLVELFENLVANAVRHGSPDDGAVTVELGVIEGGFYVADDGVGVPPDEREQVFDPAYTTADDGTGFGLRIVERIAAAHDWSVTLAESADGGARFEIHGVESPG